MGLNIIPFDILLASLQQRRPIEENLSSIVRNMEEEFEFSSLGIFLKVVKSDIFRLKIGRNLSHTFAKNTIFTQGDPLIKELMNFELMDIKYPGRYMFEKEYSHLLISPIFYHEQLMGFLFLDKEENYFEVAEMTKFEIFASLISLVVTTDTLNEEIELHKDIYESTRIYHLPAFKRNAEITFSILQRYNRYLSIAVMKLANHKSILRTFGEKKTAEMMNQISTLLQKDLRDSDIIGRLSNDTFTILLPETPSKNAALTVERLDDKINKLPFMKSSSLGWGISSKTDETESFDSLLKSAEEAAVESTRKRNKKIIVV